MKWAGRVIWLSIAALLIVIGLPWPLAFTGSLVQTVQSFAAHEKAILDHVADGRTALASATTGKICGATEFG